MVQKGLKWEIFEVSTMRKLIVCTVHLIYGVCKSRTLRSTGHVTRMEDGRGALKIVIIGKGTFRKA